MMNNPLIVGGMVLWVLPWKGFALWKASQKQHKWWFVVILVVNTMGLLEILYIFYFSNHFLSDKKKDQEVED